MEINLKNNTKTHSVNIFNREKIEIQGAVEVLSSTEKEMVIKLQENYIFVVGSGLKVSKLVPEEALLIASGNIVGVRYESKLSKKSFFGKVFK